METLAVIAALIVPVLALIALAAGIDRNNHWVHPRHGCPCVFCRGAFGDL